MKKTIMIVSTMLCIVLCAGGGITANAIEARYLACPDINCPGKVLEREVNRQIVYESPQICDEHPFCTVQKRYTEHYWVLGCTECGYLRESWCSYDNVVLIHSTPVNSLPYNCKIR